VPVDRSDGDNLEALAEAFCADHAISDAPAMALDLVARMEAIVDAPPPRRLFAGHTTSATSSTASQMASPSKPPIKPPGITAAAVEAESAEAFTVRVQAFYGAWEPAKLEDPSVVRGIVAK
jgi:hypothetical protein